MDRWGGRVALVTGANSGIGAAIAGALVEAGLKVVGADVNVDEMEEVMKQTGGKGGSLTPMKCDLKSEEEVEDLFRVIKEKFGGVDVMVNNAGVAHIRPLLDGKRKEWKNMVEVNILALMHCAKLAAASMIERKVTDGQIINICSVAGHYTHYAKEVTFYCATKHAVKFLTEALRRELAEKGHNIRVVEISPSGVNTNIAKKKRHTDEVQVSIVGPMLNPKVIANEVLHILSLPPEVEINSLIVRATGDRSESLNSLAK